EDTPFLGPALLGDRAGEQAEAFTEGDVLELEVAGGRREVVRGDRREAQLPVTLRRQRPTVLVALEPEDARAQDAPVAEVVPHPRLDDAEVLPDDDRPGAVGLEREDP